MSIRSVRSLAAVAAAALASSAMAQQYVNDFSTSAGNASLYGTATVVGGALRLTQDTTGQAGAMVINNYAQGLNAFTASFSLFFNTGGTFAADGVSFNLGNIPDGVIPGASENGPGNGLTVTFDAFDYDDNGIVQDAGIRVYWNGAVVAGAQFAFSSFADRNQVRPVTISLDYSGAITVTYNGNTVINAAPTGYTPQPGQRFGLAARTGGSSAEWRIDNLTITPYYLRSNCSNSAPIVGEGVWGYSYDAVGSTNDGAASCRGTSRDVWFCWLAERSGTATLTNAGLTDDDSVISVYKGCYPCSGGFGEIACDDDSGGSLTSLVTFPVKAGATYGIRVSLFGVNDFASGLEAFRVSVTPECRADFNNSGLVSVQDIFDFLAAYFAGCP